jgi:hypothetical protein
MALNPKTSLAARNRGLDAAFDVLNSGFLDIYDGAQPTDADTALGSQVKLVRLALGNPACAAAAAGSKLCNTIANGTALATGVATWATFVTAGGVRVHDVSVGTSAANLILNSVALSVGATVSCSAYSFTEAP